MKLFFIGYILLGEPNVLQYFSNTMRSSTAPNRFGLFIKVTNHTGLIDAELA